MHSPLSPRLFLLAAALFGSVLVLLTPPFQSPDEYNHFFRTCQVSEGGFFPEKRNENRLGGQLPASLDSLKNRFNYLKYQYDARTSRAALYNALSIRLEPERRVFLDFPHIAVYAPTAYLPQALGFKTAALFTDRVLILLYAARLANLLVWIALVFLALRALPFFRPAITLLALLPASLAVAASCNADVVTNGLAFWLFARACRQGLRLREVGATLPLALIALHKLILAPFGALAGLPALGADGWRAALRHSAAPLALAFAVAICWGQVAGDWFVPYERYDPAVRDALTLNPGVDPPAQLRFVAQHPLFFAGVVGKSFVEAIPSLGAHLVGKFGWEKNYLPAWCIALLWLALVMLVFSEKNPLTRAQRGWVAGIALACVALWAITLYAIWRPVGAPVLDAWQGRYFFTLMPLGVLAAGNGWLTKWRRPVVPVAVAALILGNMALIVGILARYYHT